jgi:hypothetical protein
MENLENTNTEVNEVIENPEVNEVDTGVVDTKETQEKPVFKAWLKKEEEVKEQSIPYSRFKEVNDEKKAYAVKLEEYESKLSQYENRKKELESIKDPSQLDPNKFESVEAYMKAYGEAVKEQAISEIEQRNIVRKQNELQQQKAQELENNYQKNISDAIKRNPEIAEANNHINELAKRGQINADIAYELMMDENVGELIYDIATDQDLLNEMVSGNPRDFIRKLHKMSAKIDKEARYAGSTTSTQATQATPAPVALAKKEPMKIKSNVGGKVDLDKASLADYRKLRGFRK